MIDSMETIKSDSIYMTINDVSYEWFEQDADGRIWLENVKAFATLKCKSDSIMSLLYHYDEEQAYPAVEKYSPTSKSVIQDYKDSVMVKLVDNAEFEHTDFIELWIQYGSSDQWKLRPVSPIIKMTDYVREDLRALISSIHSIESSQASNSSSAYYYDLSGRRLSAPPAKGMYIQDKRVKIKK